MESRFQFTMLISAIILVVFTTGNSTFAQTQNSQSISERLQSPAERRIREQLTRQKLSDRRLQLPAGQRLEVGDQSSSAQSLPIERDGSVGFPTRGEQPELVLVDPLILDPNESVTGEPADGLELGSLETFEQLAIENHPTLNAAVARILTARHEALQAGLLPNPQLGLFIDEAGNENDPGLWGAYLQRNVIRGNKLALGRKVKNREAGVLEIDFESQILRIKTDVRIAFYRLLISQEKYKLATQLHQSQQNAVSKSNQLFDAGETPRTDLLQTELQAQKAMVLLSQSEVSVNNAWRELATVVGQPDLAQRPVTGSFDPIVEPVSFEYCLEKILNNSPELQAAKAEVERVRTTVDQACAQAIPNYQTQISLGRDSNSNHFFTGVQLQVPLQIHNRNQGNIAAAKSRLVTAQNNVETVKLKLSKQLSTEYRLYQSAVVKSELFADNLLPNSQKTLDLLATGYPDEVSFIRLVTAQQTVIDITIEYLNALEQLWSSRLKIEGLLLDDSLGQAVN